MPLKIALLGIYHESNTYVEHSTTLEDFKNGHHLKGKAIRYEYQHAHHEIGGMMEVLDREEGIELIPVMYAEATPGGTISSATYKELLQEMMHELERVLPVDACLVVPHGAAVNEDFLDMDGHWLSELRKKVGSAIPVVGTLDLHANVSPLMVSSTNGLISYKQNPHIDQRQRGKDAAALLLQILSGRIKPVQTLVQVPVAISIEQQFTDREPCKGLYIYASQLAAGKDILSVSIQLGFPYADVEEMGTSVIVIANTMEAASETADKVAQYIIDNKETFVGKKIDIPNALALAKGSKKPVLLLDMGDNVGGGGPGNNSCLLEALEELKSIKYFICMYDRCAVKESAKHKIGETFNLSIMGTSKNGKTTQTIKVTLLKITDGNFKEDNPRHGGQVNFKMGETAIVSTDQGSIIMLTSLRVLPFSLQQLLSCDIIPTEFDAIIAKGVNAPIAAYASVCPTIIQVNTPGVTQADMTLFNYLHRRKPLFPFENYVEKILTIE